jgi:hypothetical protein
MNCVDELHSREADLVRHLGDQLAAMKRTMRWNDAAFFSQLACLFAFGASARTGTHGAAVVLALAVVSTVVTALANRAQRRENAATGLVRRAYLDVSHLHSAALVELAEMAGVDLSISKGAA